MNHKILIIDGDQLHTGSLQASREDNFTFLHCRNAADARQYMGEHVELIVCDLSTNRTGTFDLIREWKHAGCPPFIFLVSAGDVQSAIEGMKLGAVDCLVKPVDMDKLRQLVDQTMESCVRRTDARSANGASNPTNPGSGPHNLEIPEGTSLEDLERAAVERALQQHHGNRTHAARELGISVRTLQRKLKAWRLPILSLHHFSAGANGIHAYD
jgi:DNA-binding NtrC family response regulator